MAKIFYRERNKIDAGDRQPRFAVVGVHGADMTFFQFHLRRGELEAIAQSIGAELVALPRGHGEHAGQQGGGGKTPRGRRAHGKRSSRTRA